MVHWSESFWGDGNRGFELLANNVKNGAIAIEEFQRFLNERYATRMSRTRDRMDVSQPSPLCFLVVVVVRLHAERASRENRLQRGEGDRE